jgi:hypothetical protein
LAHGGVFAAALIDRHAQLRDRRELRQPHGFEGGVLTLQTRELSPGDWGRVGPSRPRYARRPAVAQRAG